MPRRTPSSKEVERAAIRALAAFLSRVLRRRRTLVLVVALTLGISVAPRAQAQALTEGQVLATLRSGELPKVDLARLARTTKNPELANRLVEALKATGGRQALPLLDALAAGRSRLQKTESDGLATRARLAAADVRLRVASEIIQRRLKA